MATEKPRGFGPFDALARKLAKVSKDDVEKKIKTDKAARKKARRNKK